MDVSITLHSTFYILHSTIVKTIVYPAPDRAA